MDTNPHDPQDDEIWERGIAHAFRKAGLRRTETQLEAIQRATGASSCVRLLPQGAWEPGMRTIPGLERQAIEGGEPRYTVLAEISRDDRSVVLEALDRDLGRPVALKLLPEERAADETAVRRLVEQARIGGQLQHPGIAPVYGIGAGADDRPFFATKHVAGATLAELLAGSPDAPSLDLLAIFEQVAMAVAYAHARGVPHGDLAPGNVVVEAYGEVLVVDWGQAGAGGSLQADVAALGAMLEDVLRASGDEDEELRAIGRSCATSVPDAGPADAGDVAEAVSGRLIAREEEARQAELDAVREKARAAAEQARATMEQRRAERERRARLRTMIGAAVILLALVAGGVPALGKAGEDRAALERAEARVADAMREAARTEGEGNLTAALAWAHQATTLAQSEVADPEALSRADDLLARLEQEERLEREDAELLARIEEARMQHLEQVPDASALDHSYRAAFLACGIDVQAMDPEEAAEAIRARTRPLEVVAAVDDWAKLRWNRRNLEGTDGDRLLLVLRLADPDDWRNRLRDAARELDPAVVRDLAASADLGALPARTLQLLGRLLARAGETAIALEILERAVLDHPLDARLLDDLSDQYLAVEPPRPGDAVACLLQSLAVRPGSPYLWNALGRALSLDGEAEEAVAAFRRAVEIAPDMPGPAFNLGVTLGTNEEAESWLRRAAEMAPNDPSCPDQLGCTLFHLGRPAEAEEAFRVALGLDETYTRARINLGDALEGQGRLDEALQAFERATTVEPRHPRAWLKLAEFRHRQGDLENAIGAYRRHFAVVRGDARSRMHFALALNGTDVRDEALAVLLEAQEMAPDWPLLAFNLGVQYEMLGDPACAVPHLRAAARGNPKHVRPWLALGHNLQETGDDRGAADAYREAIAVNPGRPGLESALAWLLLTTDDPDVQSAEEACGLAEAAAGRAGRASQWSALALALCRLERYGAAIEAVEQAEEIRGSAGGWDLLVLATSQSRLGRREAALANLERAEAWMAQNEHDEALRAFRDELGTLSGEDE